MASTKVFVGSLPPNTKPEELRHLFENYGIVIECDIMNRCGFVHMKNPVMAASAITGLNATDFKGQTIVVEPGRTRVHESVQRSERSPITHYAVRGGFKNFGRDQMGRSVSLASGYGNTQEVNSYHHYHQHSIDDFYERPNQRSGMPVNYRGNGRGGRMYQSSRSNFLTSNRPAPYYKPFNNINNNHSFEERRDDNYNNYDQSYYSRRELSSRGINNAPNDSPPENHYVSKIHSRNSGKYDNMQRNWYRNDRNSSINYNYSTSERSQSTDYYHRNRHSDDINRNAVEFYTGDLSSASFKIKAPHTNSSISNEQRDRRGYALPNASNDNQSYNKWKQQDKIYRESEHSTRMERNHRTASNIYDDVRGRGDYRNVDVGYDSLNYRREYPPLPPSGRPYTYNSNNQQQIGYSNRSNIPHRR